MLLLEIWGDYALELSARKCIIQVLIRCDSRHGQHQLKRKDYWYNTIKWYNIKSGANPVCIWVCVCIKNLCFPCQYLSYSHIEPVIRTLKVIISRYTLWMVNAHSHAKINAWWRNQMETFSALLALWAGNSLVTGEFLSQRSVTRSFDVFFDLHLNKQLSKQSWRLWCETLLRSLWRHCNATYGEITWLHMAYNWKRPDAYTWRDQKPIFGLYTERPET